MSASAVVFMLLTMGAVVALSAICVVAWVRARSPRPPAGGAPPKEPRGSAARVRGGPGGGEAPGAEQ
ncbi:MAG: hypothetical protein QME96_09505, partial [Myxococcota bacterium]|nr:hypothetical protein [Myxococcota bacterium]